MKRRPCWWHQTNPLRVKLFSYVNTFFCFNKFAWLLVTWVHTVYDVNIQIFCARADFSARAQKISMHFVYCPVNVFNVSKFRVLRRARMWTANFLVSIWNSESFFFISCQKVVFSQEYKLKWGTVTISSMFLRKKFNLPDVTFPNSRNRSFCC